MRLLPIPQAPLWRPVRRVLRRAARPLILATAACAVSGCATWKSRYTNSQEQPDYSLIVNRPTDPYRLAMIEFTEWGSYHDYTQIQRAEKVIAKTSKPLVVAYIHGWHNNNASDDVSRFKDFLNRLSQTESVKQNGFHVVGVYLAWNGESLTVPVLNQLTILDRKAAAERLASNGHCLDALLRVGKAARMAPGEAHYTVFLGHSLGALVLERTLAHTLLTARYGSSGELPCHLAIMLNSAADAVLTRQLMSSFYRRYEHKGRYYVPKDGGESIHEERPAIVSITADNDWATGFTFPVATRFSNVGHFKSAWVDLPPGRSQPATERKADEMTLHRTTPGNSRHLVNREVNSHGDGSSRRPTGRDALEVNLQENIKDGVFYTSEVKNYPATDAAKKADVKSRGAAGEKTWAKWQLVPTTGAPGKRGIPWDGPDVPYWNLRVPPEIIDSHGGIWSANNMALMAAIFRLHVPLERQGRPAPAPSPAATRLLPPTPPSPALEAVRPARATEL